MYYNKRGFTFIEILIYIGIIGAVIVSFMSFMLFISHARTTTEVKQEVQSNARIGLDFMLEKIRAANQINEGASVFGSHPGVLALVQGATNRVFSVSANGALVMAENGNSPISLTSKKVKVNTLIFTNLSQPGQRGNIKIQLILENNFGKDIVYAYTLQSAASLRL
jgi:type II secretory pathway pseudopilin PulG